MGEIDEGQKLVNAIKRFICNQTLHLEIIGSGEVGIDSGRFHHRADLFSCRVYTFIGTLDSEQLKRSLIGIGKSRYNTNERGFSRAVLADKSVDVTLVDGHIDTTQYSLVFVAFAYAVYFQYSLHLCSS